MLEKVPSKLAEKVAATVKIPVIGIGAGKYVDGQVLVTHDLLGMTHEFNPRFLRRYLSLFSEVIMQFPPLYLMLKKEISQMKKNSTND